MGWVLLYAVVLFLLLFFCLNHLRCLMIRLSCAWQIWKMCRRGKAKLHRAHLFWFLGSRFGRRCDFYLETPHCIFSIIHFSTKDSQQLRFQDLRSLIDYRHIKPFDSKQFGFGSNGSNSPYINPAGRHPSQHITPFLAWCQYIFQ